MTVTAQSGRMKRRIPRIAMALPSLVWYIAFFVVPLIVIVVYSFGYKPPATAETGRETALRPP